jgi:dinuclear metal center YbgI/SA1388 family protein
MPTIGDLLKHLDEIAPPHLAFPDDPIGLQLGRKSDAVSTCVVTLDSTPQCIAFAKQQGAQCIVSHHPPIYNPIPSLAGDSLSVQVIREAITNNIALIAAHTNWDTADGGVNDTLAKLIGLTDITPFGDDVDSNNYKLTVFVPQDHRERLIDALAAAGAGGVGDYKRCAFYGDGEGTFEPQEGTNPYIGEPGKREHVEETRIEMLVPHHRRYQVEKALKETHPYEEPAYDFLHTASPPFSLPRMGNLSAAVGLVDFVGQVENALESPCRAYGKPDRKIKTVGVVGGSGGRYWMKAKIAGCDALVTGEARHHEAVEAAESGFALIDAGHHGTEQPGVRELKNRLAAAMNDLQFHVFEPLRGLGGSPVEP